MIAGLGCCQAFLHLKFCHWGNLASAAVLLPGCAALHHLETNLSGSVAGVVGKPGCWQPVLLHQWHYCPPWAAFHQPCHAACAASLAGCVMAAMGTRTLQTDLGELQQS